MSDKDEHNVNHEEKTAADPKTKILEKPKYKHLRASDDPEMCLKALQNETKS